MHQRRQLPPPAPVRGSNYHQQHQQQHHHQKHNGNPVVGYRRTSAEIVSEARTLLAGVGGTRLVSTRRPITPREPRRQLYGKLAPPGRPPSAFSLRYLQFENRQIPPLEPIHQQPSKQQSSSITGPTALEEIPIVPRSGSVGTLLDYVGANSNNNNNNNSTSNNLNVTSNGRLQGKLPALLSPPKITASLDNLSEEMPPHPDLPCKKLNENNNNKKDAEINDNDEGRMELLKKDLELKEHPLKKRQTRSFDMPTKPSDPIEVKEKSLSKIELTSGGSGGAGSSSSKKRDGPHGAGGPLLSKTRLTRSNDLLAQSSTETLLDLLKAHSGIKECNEETVQHINAILIELYTRVKGAKGNWRSAILGGLYGLVECSSAKILLAVGRVVLALCVTGSNLTGACKLVFKVARSETNDHLFADTDVPELLIDGLGRASPIDDPEACIYGYGAVRFLASASQGISNTTSAPANLNSKNPPAQQIDNKKKSLAQRLARHGAVQLMVLHLQIMNESGATKNLSGQPLHALYQLAAALRALAGVPQVLANNCNATRPSINGNEEHDFPIIRETKEPPEINLELACPHLVKAAEISIGEAEIQSNIVRTLSVLSEHDACCESLSEYAARIGMLLGPCNVETKGLPEKPLALLSRLGYILGNIMARFDSARIQFFNNDVAMQYLLEALEAYSKQKFTIHNQMGDTVVDVLIKLVRVVANMSVNADVGYGLSTIPPLGQILLHILLNANKPKGSQMNAEMEELLQATLGALHNLSFYQDNSEKEEEIQNSPPDSLSDRMTAISVALCDILRTGPEFARAEASRVLGNMTRNPKARESFCKAGGLRAIVNCLSAEDYELVATSSGVLVNLLGDWERRAPFRELKGPLVLRDILQKSAQQEDWLLAAIVCQAMWNFLIDSGNVIGALGEQEADYIAENLAEFLDEDRIFKGEAPDILWEQFATVAADLLERIQSSMSFGNSPYSSDDDDVDLKFDKNQNNNWNG